MRPTRRPRWRIWLRRALLLGAALLVISLLFNWWLGRRAGTEFFGAPEALLPPTTAAVATWRDLSGFLEDVTRLKAFEKVRGEEDAVAMLLTSSAWRKIEQEKDKARYKILTALMGNFVRRWFGREFTLAVVEPVTRPDGRLSQSGLIAIARTDLGFEEELAELIAQWYPDLSLETRPYRGRTIYRYNAEKSKRAFSYCRLGKTVAVSMRSAHWRWLEGMIDRSLGSDAEGNPLASLADDAAFRDSADARRADEGLGMFVHPARLKTAFLALPANISTDPDWLFWLDYAKAPLEQTEWGALRLTLAEGLRIDSFWKYRLEEKRAQAPLPSPASTVDNILQALPADSAALIVAESPGLRETFLDLRDRMAQSEAYAECLKNFETAWREATGVDFRADVLEPMGPATGAALTGMSANLLIPMPEMFFWWEYASPEAAREIEQRLTQENPSGRIVSPAIPCQWTFAAEERNLVVRQINGGTGTTAPTSQAGGLLNHPLLADRRNPESPRSVLSFFINFESAHVHLQRLQRLRAAAALWSKDMREDVEEWETILAAMRHLHGLRLTATPRAEGVDVNLLITVN